MRSDEKVGLVLEGGGVKGACEAGVLSLLSPLGASFDGVAGTSIGAINAGLYLDGGVDLVLKMWAEVWAGTVVDIDEDALLRVKNRDIDKDLLLYMGKKLIKFRSLIEKSYVKTENFFSGKVSEERIRASGKQLGIVTYCVTDRQPLELLMDEIPKGLLVEYLIASATYPIFPPKEIEGKKYIDGGVYDNMPVNLLARGGYKKQLVIRTNVADKKPRRKAEDDLDLFYILPDEDLGHAMAFTSGKVERLMEKGKEDARRALDNGLREFLGL